MAYFSRFPLVKHDGELQVNLTRRVGVDEKFKTNPAVFYEHEIQDSDTPENLADRFYDDVNYAWIILQFNDIVNVFEQWPKSQFELDEYIKEKYENPYGIHHYISLSTGVIVSADIHPTYDRIPVTNYEYEVEVNDSKRKIKLVLPELANEMALMHKEKIERGLY